MEGFDEHEERFETDRQRQVRSGAAREWKKWEEVETVTR